MFEGSSGADGADPEGGPLACLERSSGRNGGRLGDLANGEVRTSRERR